VSDAEAAVARMTAMSPRARSFARDRLAKMSETLRGAGQESPLAGILADLIEDEIAGGFLVGYAARDEQTAVGRLPRPRSKRK